MEAYAGLTDDLVLRKVEHGNPADWRWVGPFPSEAVARDWQNRMLAAGCQGERGGSGWKYGYVYTITDATMQ